jgi:hypothetical protein
MLTLSDERMCWMKGELYVNVSPDKVFDCITDINKRMEWDFMFSEGRAVETVNDKINYVILHLLGQENQSKAKGLDYCILQATVDCKNNKDPSIECGGACYIISEYSTKHSQVPLRDDYARGQVFAPSGFLVYPVKSRDQTSVEKESTKLVFMLRQLGHEVLGANLITQWEVFAKSLVRLREFLTEEM